MGEVEERNIGLVMEHFEAESRHDYERTLATLADEIEYRIVPVGMTLRGKKDATRYYDLWWGAFPDVTIQVDRIAAAGEWVIAEATSVATHLGPFMGIPPTGRRVEAHTCALIRVRDGKMVEETVYYDVLERLMQVGSTIELDGHRLELPQAMARR